MATDNPMASGPNFVEFLCWALERWPNSFAPKSPSTGGAQISLRLRNDRLVLIDVLSAKSGWNRNQVIDALIDGSLFQLFEKLSDTTSEAIRNDHATKVLRA